MGLSKLGFGFGVASVLVAWSSSSPSARAALLIGNTSGNNVVAVDERSGRLLGNFITPGSGGLTSPDDLTFGPDGNLYVSSGTNTSGQVLRYDGRTGKFIDTFTKGGTLFRPYGNAFGPDGNLYVSSFRTDEIARFDGATGQFIDIFAAGTRTANGLNGPNDLLFGPDGALYVSTQGSVADGTGDITFAFDSQVLRYDIATGAGEVFIEQPAPLDTSFGFVSFLGLATGPDGNLYTSDFANGIRSYDFLSGSLLSELETAYTFFDDAGTLRSGNFIGSLAFTPDDELFTVGFDFTDGDRGAVLRYDALTGAPFPSPGQPGAVFVPSTDELLRPIGIAYTSTPVPEPTLTAGLLLAGAWSIRSRVRKADRQ
ncbi:MAG: PEP-CTERM sorting domain-containing protein [Cyanobacteria bacterium J06639_1]